MSLRESDTTHPLTTRPFYVSEYVPDVSPTNEPRRSNCVCGGNVEDMFNVPAAKGTRDGRVVPIKRNPPM